MNTESLSIWKERIADRQNKSDMKLKEWCEQNQLSKHAYYYWRHKIAELQIKEQTGQLFTEFTVPAPSRFLPEASNINHQGILVRWRDVSIQLTDSPSAKLAAELLVQISELC